MRKKCKTNNEKQQQQKYEYFKMHLKILNRTAFFFLLKYMFAYSSSYNISLC